MTKQKSEIKRGTIVLIAFLVLLVSFCVFQTRRAPVFAAFVGLIGFACVAAIAHGKMIGDRTGYNAYGFIGVGSCVLTVMVFLLAMTGAIFPAEDHFYDYRESLDQVSSVELVKVTKDGWNGDEFEYQLIRTVPEKDWKDMIDRIAALCYFRPFNDPPTGTLNETGILIRFSSPVDGVNMVLIVQSCPCWWEEKQMGSNNEKCANGDALNALLDACGK